MSLYRDNKYVIQVKDQRSLDGCNEDGAITSGCHVIIYDAGTKTKSTIYSDNARTAKTNDITRTQFATDGCIVFWSPNSSHDVFVADEKGNNTLVTSATPQTHTIGLNRDNPNKCLFFPMVFNSGATETDTGLDIPYKAHVKDCRVEVVTVDATETVDIGLLSSETAGDADGFRAAVSVATAGFVAPVAYTVGSNETYLSSCTYGALIASKSLGNDVATDVGSLNLNGHFTDGANAVSVTYTPSTSDTFAGYGYIYYTVLR